MQRPSGRKTDQLRSLTITPNVSRYAEGSCLIKLGETHVFCTATVEEKVLPFLRNSGTGWVTAEYSMLPRATKERTDREASRGKQTGRTQEIQRLIGRSLRAVTDLKALGERQIKIDCDVLQADGGTRTAAITGGYVALHLALTHLVNEKIIEAMPLKDSLAAVSCGIYKGQPILDLDYEEDSMADADVNFVMTGSGHIVEIQGTAEKRTFEEHEFFELLQLAKLGMKYIGKYQLETLTRGPSS